jgi:hypothetical protein
MGGDIQYIPDGVEDMDLSGCTNLIFEKGNLSYSTYSTPPLHTH